MNKVAGGWCTSYCYILLAVKKTHHSAVADTTAFACCLHPPRPIIILQIVRRCYRVNALELIIDAQSPADTIENASYVTSQVTAGNCVALQVDKTSHAFR